MLLLAFAVLMGHPVTLLLALVTFALMFGTVAVASHPNPLVPSTSPDASTVPAQAANLINQFEILTGTTDAITGGGGKLNLPGGPAAPICGTSFIESSGVDATTLATPATGDPAAGGNDGLDITIVDVGGHAHTVTAAAGKIVPAHNLITFGGTAGSWVTLRARGGKWYPIGSAGVTIS